MPAVTVFVTECGPTDDVVVFAPARSAETNAVLIALREQFGERVRVVREIVDDPARRRPR